ncbi:MAG: AAA family ATPase [Myxococcales bacterium]|nr:AAA family ATPase [Myxococcales bacterium]
MLERIRVRGFKSLQDVDVPLGRLTVLIGPNSAGKSNFLEALVLLSRLVTERTLVDAFEGALRGYPLEGFTLPRGGLAEQLERARIEMALEADLTVEGPPDAHRLRYGVGVAIEPATGTLAVTSEHMTRLGANGEPRSGFRPRIETARGDGEDSSRPTHLLVRHLSRPGAPIREDIGLPHTVASNQQFSGDRRYPDFDRLRAELGAWRIYYLDPRSAMRAAQPPREVDHIGARGEFIAPFLHGLKNDPSTLRYFKAIGRALATMLPIDGLDVDLDPARATLDVVVKQHGTPFSSRVLSEGTLRLLALCAIAASPGSGRLIAFEEPENGVHPRRIDTVAQLVVNMARRQDRQVVVTTHSPRFAAAVARLAQADEERDDIRILKVAARSRATTIEPLHLDLPLLADSEAAKALRDPDEEALLTAVYQRGWIDG